MITRDQYMKDSSLHHAFYLELAKECGVRFNSVEVDKFRKALRTDKHMNNIPLSWWDARAVAYKGCRRQYADHGDHVSLGGLVCMLKAMARHQAQQGGT